MKTIDCLMLERLLENREPVKLIDIRSKQEFRASHIPEARSVPFAELATTKGYSGHRFTNQHVCVVADNRIQASLAIGILKGSGYTNAVVVDGGMKAWVGGGFPISSTKDASLKLHHCLTALLVLLAIVAIAFAKTLLVPFLFVCVGALLYKVSLLARLPARGNRKFDLAKIRSAAWCGINGPRLLRS